MDSALLIETSRVVPSAHLQFIHVICGDCLEKLCSLGTSNEETIHMRSVEYANCVPDGQVFLSNVCISDRHLPARKRDYISMSFVPFE